MASFSVYDHIYSRREQLLSTLTTVSLYPRHLFPTYRSGPRSEGHSSNAVFHFSRIRRGDSLPIAIARHQHLLFNHLHLRPKKTVLALYCGNGAISQQLVHFSDVNVVGIDTDIHLISRAKIAAEEAGLTSRLTYHHARDICEALERLPDCSFDAVFAVELGYRIPSRMTLYRHINRLLKPSGKFAIYEWCFADAMSQTNSDHVAVAQNLLRSFPKMAQVDSISTIARLVAAVSAAGLVNVTATDLVLRDSDVPWYRPLESHQNARSNSTVALAWWYGQLSIEALLTAARLRIFSPMVLVTGDKGGKQQ